MKTQVDAALRETQESLNGLGDAPPETTPKRRKLLRESAGAITRDVRDASYFTMYQGVLAENKERIRMGVLAENKELRMVARYRKGASRFSDSVLKLKPERTVEGIKALVAELRGRELPGMANPAVMRVLVRAHSSVAIL
ncbi:hypothetical protein T484DRAFT_1787066 [Baffinella frigidus]|nr:hypothetical protein T484DRAFT_1787066 [Cryptophyta sp. CCMP2293]